jgi:hypothetical protein
MTKPVKHPQQIEQTPSEPGGVILTRDTVAHPIRLTMWRNGADVRSVDLSDQAALNLMVDIAVSLRANFSITKEKPNA